ncbi:MAG: hypothetical protein JWN32_2646 [Solirubrobacterales bacterium]|nr:hypothetical protein [Solirubrobacterales bacterium]
MRRLRSQDGAVVAIVVMILAIGLLVGGAAVAETLSTRSHANRDLRSQRALHAANAGIQAVLYQQNELDLRSLELNGGPLGLSTLLDCVVPKLDVSLKVTGLVSTTVNSAGICPATDGTGGGGSGYVGQPTGDHGYYQAVFVPGATAPGGASSGRVILNPAVVSLAWDDNGNAADTSHYVMRKVEAVLAPIDPLQALEAAHDLKINGLLGLTSVLNGNARANNDVTVPPLLFANTNLSNGLIGSVTYGNNYSGLLSLSHLYHTSNSVNRSVVSISPSKADCSVASNCSALGATYSSTTHKFSLTNSATVNFGPGDYVFCDFNATSGTLNFNATAAAPVRIFIDSPTSTRCSGNSGSQGNFVAKKGVQNALAGLANATGATGLQIYVVGNGTYNGTTVEIDGTNPGVIQSAIVYAPKSQVSETAGCLLFLCIGLEGSVIGYDTTINATLFTQDLELSNYPLYAGLGAFHVQKYVECAASYPLSPTNPTSGC